MRLLYVKVDDIYYIPTSEKRSATDNSIGGCTIIETTYGFEIHFFDKLMGSSKYKGLPNAVLQVGRNCIQEVKYYIED